MKIKTPPLNVDNTETKIDGGIDFSFDSNIQSSVNVPMVKVQIDIPQIWIRLDMKRKALTHWRLTGVVTPKIQGTPVDQIKVEHEHIYGQPINMSTQIDQSQLIQVLMNAVLKGLAQGKIKD